MNILVILGNPNPDSFGAALASAYADGAANAGAAVRRLDLHTLDFNPILDPRDRSLGDGARQGADIQAAREAISWSDHMAFVYPVWWGGVPALLKGFIDVTFLAGFSHKRQESSPFPERLLQGRSARCIETMDAPDFWYQLVYRNSAFRMMKTGTLGFCGVKPVKHTIVSNVRGLSPAQRTKKLQLIDTLARQDVARRLRA